ncbi:hypothetical protein BDV96DRAFT_649105 [Lophiotrema nucula]|uniref:Uncharacterized protein n=1 Tax=Lophiotrema nucula TaxID=690887 RepID=A0A6A5YZQ5_9PLEO|nr:hypothetical protein BDV96DRAFT_649105 [Lophiotrema nucula]
MSPALLTLSPDFSAAARLAQTQKEKDLAEHIAQRRAGTEDSVSVKTNSSSWSSIAPPLLHAALRQSSCTRPARRPKFDDRFARHNSSFGEEKQKSFTESIASGSSGMSHDGWPIQRSRRSIHSSLTSDVLLSRVVAAEPFNR